MSDELVIPDDDGSVAAAAAHLAAITAQLDSSDNDSIGALPAESGLDDPVAMKRRLAVASNNLARQQQQIEQAANELRRRAELARNDANNALAKMRSDLERLQSGIDAMNLYLGRGEMIWPLRGGEPAPVGTPLVVRQMVLSMDQECAIHADRGGIDARQADEFFDWLIADEARVEQVIPEPKSVVALVPRFTDKDYKDPWTQAAMDAANRQTFFLCRNGERLFVTTCDLVAGVRLIPQRDEFTSMFTTSDGRPLVPGSDRWDRAERAAGARQRHYMKIALVLQGLIDRTSVFAPMPDGVSLLHPESYDAGDVEVITDSELALGSGLPDFYQWLRDANSKLRPGMRIVGAFRGDAWEQANDRYDDRHSTRHSRITPLGAAPPAVGTILTIDRRDSNGDLIAKFDRTDRRWGYEHGDWGRWGEWDFKQRASLRIRPGDRFVVPIDLVDVETMERFMRSRQERSKYLSMFPVMHRAIETKRVEHDLEEPFRQLVVGELVAAGCDIDEAEAVVGELVDWWKFANRWHRPLVDPDPTVQAKAIRKIVAEHRRRSSASSSVPESTIDTIRDAHRQVMFIARVSSGVVAFEPERPDAGRDGDDVFVAEHRYTVRGAHRETRRWRLTGSRVARMLPVFTSERWERWDHAASLTEYLTDAELGDTAARLVEECAGDEFGEFDEVLHVEYLPSSRRFQVWGASGDVDVDEDRWLTGTDSERKAFAVTFSWSRTTGRAVVTRYHDRHLWVSSEFPWNDGDRHYSGRGAVELFSDRAAVDRFNAAAGDADRRKRRREGGRRAANEWVRTLGAAWKQQEIDEAFKLFCDDFGDVELWDPDTVQVKALPDGARAGGLSRLACRLVESGCPIEGLSPREALAAFDALPGTDGERRPSVADEVLDLRPG